MTTTRTLNPPSESVTLTRETVLADPAARQLWHRITRVVSNPLAWSRVHTVIVAPHAADAAILIIGWDGKEREVEHGATVPLDRLRFDDPPRFDHPLPAHNIPPSSVVEPAPPFDPDSANRFPVGEFLAYAGTVDW
jgi:hypothetical protein